MVSSGAMDYRLPGTVVPQRYDLRLEPDLEAATFAGADTAAAARSTRVIHNGGERIAIIRERWVGYFQIRWTQKRRVHSQLRILVLDGG